VNLLRHPHSQILFDYWNGVRGSRPAPRRFEIEPGRLGPALPDTFILERSFGNALTFRLAGTKVCQNLGLDPRGRQFIDGWDEADVLKLKQHLQSVLEVSAVLTLSFEAEMASGKKVEYEVLLLPLVHTANTIDRILGSISRLDEGVTSARDTVARRKLLSCLIIWPTGTPTSDITQEVGPAESDNQLPFNPHIRNARVVRHNRRQFRVYDGGLAKTTTEKF
jgi:hypothetical protein